MRKARISEPVPCIGMLILGYVILYATTTVVPVFVGSLFMMCGYLSGMAIFGALIRQLIPEHMEGRFQGLRIIGQVLIPGVIGPMIGAYVLKDAETIVNQDGTCSFLPNANIWLAAIATALVLCVSLIVAFHLIKKISKNTLVILVSHEKSIATSYSDYVIEISDGKIINEKSVDDGGFYQYDDENIYLQDFEYSHLGNDEISEPWIDEALTEYSTVLYFEEKYGKEVGDKLLRTMELQTKNHSSEDIFKATTQYKNSIEYSLNVYTKGALAFNEVRNKVGDKIFFETLKEYYNTYMFQNVNGAKFVDLWNKKGVDIDKIISEYK